METASVQKIARVLRGLVLAALVCNLIILYLVPAAVLLDSQDLLSGVREYLADIFFPGEDDIVMAGIAGSFLAWFWVWRDAYAGMLALFLVVSGVCTAVILRQALRVLDSILKSHPFCEENARALRRAAVCGFLISAAALVRVVFSVFYYRSPMPLASYNALFVPIFAMFGLLCLVMSALFRQAAELKAENDLTI
ncbi:DUF2975 domain-containing protein [Dysosmobacter sp.]|uniref:DUF2975 domain-containing protein n=1 Tax=Dysosmobacter sp. TaxID=2591382 RepID=UPI002A86B51D|nr:DUF2975 domain-containing protein [Dysosmobacter sp.]MDY3985797.1 DUF2975 domain-containing protein [Dysosmobacter sp.]